MPTKRPENLMPKDAVKAWGRDKIVVTAQPRQSGGVAVRFTDGTREVYPSGVQIEVADVDNDPEHEGVTDEQRSAEVEAALADAGDFTETAETVEAEVAAMVAADSPEARERFAEVDAQEVPDDDEAGAAAAAEEAAAESDARQAEEAADRAAFENASRPA